MRECHHNQIVTSCTSRSRIRVRVRIRLRVRVRLRVSLSLQDAAGYIRCVMSISACNTQ